MRKWIALLLALVMCFALCACGGGKKDAKDSDADAASSANKLGDTVSTDIMNVTVKDAQLSVYAEAPATDTGDGKTTNLDKACLPTEDAAFFVANKGRTLVCLDVVIENTDRGTLDTDDDIVTFQIRQDGEEAPVRGYDLNDPDGSYSLNLTWAPIAENGGDFYTNRSMNKLISAGRSVEIKVVGIAGFESADLNAPFDLIVSVMKADGSAEEFTYTIGG